MEDCKPNEGIAIAVDSLDHEAGHSTTQLREEEEEASKRRKVLIDSGAVGESRAAHSSAAAELGKSSCSSSSAVDSKSIAGGDGDCSGLAATAEDESSAASSSCCSSNESSDVVKDGLSVVDLEAKSNYESEKISHSTSLNIIINNANKFRRETTPSRELCVDSEEITELASPTKRKSPPREEIEEFFAEAEKADQKRFTEKYNYDIVKDLPLEGRYQWVSLKP